MTVEIDTCGFSCPQPVLMFLNAVKSDPEGEYDVLVDTDASRENVGRAAVNRGFNVNEIPEKDGVTRLQIRKG